MQHTHNPNIEILTRAVERPGEVSHKEEVEVTDRRLIREIRVLFTQLLEDQRFIEALPVHLPGDPASQTRLPGVLERIRLLAGFH